MIAYFPTILGLGIDNIRGRIDDLRELGVADPVKMITSSPTILGLAMDNIRGKITDLRELGFSDPVRMVTSPRSWAMRESRILLCGRIVMCLEERNDDMLGRLIEEWRAVIDEVAVAQPRTWSDARADHRHDEESRRLHRKGDIAMRTVEKQRRPSKSATCDQRSLLSPLLLEVAFPQHLG